MTDEITWKTTHGDKVEVWRSVQMHVAEDGPIAHVTNWYWHVVARNGRVVEQGEGYTRRHDAVKAAERHHPRVES